MNGEQPFEWHTTECLIMKWRGTKLCNCPSIRITNLLRKAVNQSLNRRGE